MPKKASPKLPVHFLDHRRPGIVSDALEKHILKHTDGPGFITWLYEFWEAHEGNILHEEALPSIRGKEGALRKQALRAPIHSDWLKRATIIRGKHPKWTANRIAQKICGDLQDENRHNADFKPPGEKTVRTVLKKAWPKAS